MRRGLAILLIMTAASFALSLAYWSRVPDPMPKHWNGAGQVDGYSSRALGLLLMPGILAVLTVILAAVALCNRNSAAAVAIIDSAAGGFMLFMHGLMIRAALTPGHALSMGAIIVGLGLMFIVMGRQMPNLPRNRWCGVRTRWTLHSDRVWRETHLYAARTMPIGGLVAVLAGLLLSPLSGFIVGMIGILAGSLAPVVYSYFSARADAEAGA